MNNKFYPLSPLAPNPQILHYIPSFFAGNTLFASS